MVNLIPSRFEYFSRMELSGKAFNNSTRNYEMVYLAHNLMIIGIKRFSLGWQN